MSGPDGDVVAKRVEQVLRAAGATGRVRARVLTASTGSPANVIRAESGEREAAEALKAGADSR